MPSLADAFGDESEKRRRDLAKIGGRFKVATTVPFEVYLDGSTDAMPGRKVPGLSYIVGTTGMYLLLGQGLKPLCFPDA